MTLLNFFVNAYEVMQNYEDTKEQGEDSLPKYLLKNKDKITETLAKENTPKEMAIKFFTSKVMVEKHPDLADFVRKNYVDMKK